MRLNETSHQSKSDRPVCGGLFDGADDEIEGIGRLKGDAIAGFRELADCGDGVEDATLHFRMVQSRGLNRGVDDFSVFRNGELNDYKALEIGIQLGLFFEAGFEVAAMHGNGSVDDVSVPFFRVNLAGLALNSLCLDGRGFGWPGIGRQDDFRAAFTRIDGAGIDFGRGQDDFSMGRGSTCREICDPEKELSHRDMILTRKIELKGDGYFWVPTMGTLLSGVKGSSAL